MKKRNRRVCLLLAGPRMLASSQVFSAASWPIPGCLALGSDPPPPPQPGYSGLSLQHLSSDAPESAVSTVQPLRTR